MEVTLPPPPTPPAEFDRVNRHPEAVAERRYLASLKKEAQVWATERDAEEYDDKGPWFEQPPDPWLPSSS